MEKEFLKSINEYQNIIYRICKTYRDRKEDQDDLFQEIVFQLWKSFPSFKGESKISSWIYKIALNTAVIFFRKPKLGFDVIANFPERIHPQSEEDFSENEEKLFWAIRKLNSSERALMSLYLEDLSYLEIAEIIGISENNVGVKLNRIKNKLKELIK